MTSNHLYVVAACVTPALYAVMAVAAARLGRWREAAIAGLFAASNAVIFWR